MKRKLFTIITLSFALTLLLVGCGAAKIDMKDYASVTFSGTDGRGTAELFIDYSSLADAMNKAKKDDDARTSFVDAFYASALVDYSFDKSEGLSNGDNITVSISIPENVKDTYEFKAATSELKVKVDGLKVPEKLDAFTDVNVHFSGYSPYAAASVENNSDNEFLKHAIYQVAPQTDLKNGDTVTVTIEYTDEMIDKYGFVPDADTKEFEVNGLDSYAESFDDLSDDCRANVYSDSKDRVDALIAEKSTIIKNFAGTFWNYQYNVDGENVKKISEYFLASKGSDFDCDYYNVYSTVYKTTGEINAYQHYKGDIIIVVSYYNITTDRDGNNNVDLSGAQYSFFANEANAYSRWITSCKDRYKVYEQKAGE